MGLEGKLHLFDRARLRRLTIKPRSIMPTDNAKGLAPEKLRDLMAFPTRQSLLYAANAPAILLLAAARVCAQNGSVPA